MRHTAREMSVRDILQLAEVLLPTDARARERLGDDTAFAVNVRGGSAGTDRLEGVTAGEAHGHRTMRPPEFAHRRVGILPVLKKVAIDDVAERGLVVHLKPRVMRQLGHVPVIVFRDEVAVRPPPVRQKPLRGLRRVDNPAEKRRDPSAERITVRIGEILLHLRRPGLSEALPTVDEHPAHLALQDTLVESSDVTLEIRLDACGIEFVALPARGLFRSGSVDALRVDVPEADDRPLPGGNGPFGLARQVDDARRIDPCGFFLRRRVFVQQRTQRPRALALPVGMPRC